MIQVRQESRPYQACHQQTLKPYQDSTQSPCRMKQERLLLLVAGTGKPDMREGCSLSGPTILVSLLYSLTTKHRCGIQPLGGSGTPLEGEG